MEKSEFVARLADRLEINPQAAEGAVNATLSELVAPQVFVRPGEVGTKLLSDNNCNNNCAREQAVASPTIQAGRSG